MAHLDDETRAARPVIRVATAADADAVAGLIRPHGAQDRRAVAGGRPRGSSPVSRDDDSSPSSPSSTATSSASSPSAACRSLFHAKKSGVIQEASVAPAHQNAGIGRAPQEAVARIKPLDVAEISISTGFENERAKHLYRSLGFVEETLQLEQHL